jgi:hypothetical protein
MIGVFFKNVKKAGLSIAASGIDFRLLINYFVIGL